MNLSPIFVIPARGGSKGIPRKNIRPFLGKPLIAYSVEQALECCAKLGLGSDRIIVSTDSPEIAETARAAGAPLPHRRPDELATDSAGSREVILDAMEEAHRRGIRFDCVVLLQPTSPLRTVADIEGTMELFCRERPDMAVSVKEADANPYYNLFEADPDNGSLKVCKGDGLITRRQDAPPAWEYNGAVYVIDPEALKRYPLGALPRRLPYRMDAIRSVDLDTPLDWEIAETIARHLKDSASL